MMNSKISTILSQVASLLAEGLKPKQIFLFGSFAQGTEQSDSDLDIFIITDLKNNNKIEITQKARRLLLRKIYFPVDILVCDTKVFEYRRNNPSTLEHIVATEGIKIYGN
jgi:predicted nucleotidyltransferase